MLWNSWSWQGFWHNGTAGRYTMCLMLLTLNSWLEVLSTSKDVRESLSIHLLVTCILITSWEPPWTPLQDTTSSYNWGSYSRGQKCLFFCFQKKSRAQSKGTLWPVVHKGHLGLTCIACIATETCEGTCPWWGERITSTTFVPTGTSCWSCLLVSASKTIL